jgi:hypothetical protein
MNLDWVNLTLLESVQVGQNWVTLVYIILFLLGLQDIFKYLKESRCHKFYSKLLKLLVLNYRHLSV